MGNWMFTKTSNDSWIIFALFDGLTVSTTDIVEQIDLSDERLNFYLDERKYNLVDFIGRTLRGINEPTGLAIAYAVIQHTNGVPFCIELNPSSGRGLRVYMEDQLSLECE